MVVFAVTAAIFSPAIHAGFVNYDDEVYVYANPAINHGFNFSGITRAFTQPHAHNWHPITTITHMLDCELFGLNPGGAKFPKQCKNIDNRLPCDPISEMRM